MSKFMSVPRGTLMAPQREETDGILAVSAFFIITSAG